MAQQLTPWQLLELSPRDQAVQLLPVRARRDVEAHRVPRSSHKELRAFDRRLNRYVEGIIELEGAYVAVTVEGTAQLAELTRQRERIVEADQALSLGQRARLDRVFEESYQDAYGMLKDAQATIVQTARVLPQLLAPRPFSQRARPVLRAAAARGRAALPSLLVVGAIVGFFPFIFIVVPLLFTLFIGLLYALVKLILLVLVLVAFVAFWESA